MEEIIDYAYPCMMAERALHEVHKSMLRGDYETALEEANIALVETRIMINSIKDMRENADKRR